MDLMHFTKYLGTLQWFYVVVLFVLNVFMPRTGCENAQDFQKNIPVRLIWAAQSKDVELPCDVTSPIPNDSAKLVLWFKDSNGIPLYSLDSRGGGSLKLATHSALASDLGQRLYFSAEDNPKDARLQIRNVKLSDGGVYRCRVDFFNSATRNLRVNLSLVVPPEEPRIFDAQGKEISHIAGPFREGHELFLSCQVTGGRPQPKVTWWREGAEIAGTSHPSADEGNPAMLNQLFISTVTRDYYGSKLECRAQGSNLIEPTVKEITVQVHLKPIKIKIVSANDLLIAGKSVPLRCETWGSFPPAKITWLLDGEPIRNADITAHSDNTPDGNMTVSILNLKVSSENDGAELICRAANPWFSGGAIQDKRIISVAYPPTVSVHLANEDPSRVVTRSERENVTLKCRADARPPVASYSWFKNDMRMSGENTETLHLTQLQRESGGNYACGAQNSEETPEPPKSCELRNDTILEVVCVAGYDGGLTQHFLLEVVGGNPIYSTEVTRVGQDIIDNEISTMNDQATTAPLRRLKETIPEFKLHDLEPGREYQFLVYSVNAKGKSQPPVVMNGRIYGDTQGPHDETSQLEDPTPAETSNQDKQKQSTMVILAAVVAAGAVVITSIIVAGIVVVCKHRPKPPEPQEVRKRMRKLFVGGLSWETTEKELLEHFGQYGDIESINVKTDPQTGRSRGFAFIVYAAADSIDRVSAAEEHVINNKKVDPKKAKARHGKIFVGGLTTEISDDEIKAFFGQFGNIVEVELPFDKQKNQRKGFCFITFDSEQVVNELLKTPKQTISGKEVDVKKATPKPDNMPMSMVRGGPRGRGGRGGSGRGGYNQSWGNQGGGGYGYGQGYSGYGGYEGYGNGGYDYYGDYSGYGNYDGGYGNGVGRPGGPRGAKGGNYQGGKQRGGGGGRQPRHQPY